MMKNYAMTILIILLLGFSAESASPKWMKLDSNFKIEPFFMLQLWGVYSHETGADFEKTGEYEAVDDRFNLHVRRGRLGFKGAPYKNLKFSFVAFFDGLGRDALSSSIGPANSPLGQVFGVWDAFISWKILNSDGLNMTAGFFRPQLGRESITSGYATTSGEKAMQQNYLRNHLVNSGPGRALGFNFGGLALNSNKNFGMDYNVGFFNPTNTSSISNTGGKSWAPLLVGRAALHFGDPEKDKYSIGYKTNFYNKRKGLSLGFGGSYQGETDIFTQSTALSGDLLFNWKYFNLDAEYNLMNRKDDRIVSVYDPERNIDYTIEAGHIRASWNINIGDYILEPVVMYEEFWGTNDANEKTDAGKVKSFTGKVITKNVGVNFYLNQHKFKIIAHYLINQGSNGRNVWNSQSALGLPLDRGNYFILGLNAIF